MMAQYAPVMPPQLARNIKPYGDHVIGTYHLLLAHDVAERPEAYEDLYPHNAFIVMDNSVIELGHPVDFHTMSEAVKAVRPRIIVLPDVIKNRDETVELSREFAERYAPLLQPDQRFMAVPQGNTYDELRECARTLKSIPGVGAWGVGRFITEMLGSRVPMVHALCTEHDLLLGSTGRFAPFVHMLGFSNDLADDMTAASIRGVMGIDSAAPVRMGQSGLLMKPDGYGHVIRGNWWEEEKGDLHAATIANIMMVRDWMAFGKA